MIAKSSIDPCVRGSSVTDDIIAAVVLSRLRAARKNWLSICCSGGREHAIVEQSYGGSRS